jgi:hypothetical protein
LFGSSHTTSVNPELTAALGARPQPPKWKGSGFDIVSLISYSYGKILLTDLPEKLGTAP